jgi:HSP20 family protein
VIESEKELTITAELPGVEKKDIEIKKEKGKVIIRVDSKDRKFFKEIPLKQRVDPKSAKARFKNGVLEITFKILKPKKKAKGNIKID